MTARLRLPRPTFRGLRTSTSRYLDLIEDNLPSHPRSKRPSVQNLSTDLPTQAPNPTQQPNPTQPNPTQPTNQHNTTTRPNRPNPTHSTQPNQPIRISSRSTYALAPTQEPGSVGHDQGHSLDSASVSTTASARLAFKARASGLLCCKIDSESDASGSRAEARVCSCQWGIADSAGCFLDLDLNLDLGWRDERDESSRARILRTTLTGRVNLSGQSQARTLLNPLAVSYVTPGRHTTPAPPPIHIQIINLSLHLDAPVTSDQSSPRLPTPDSQLPTPNSRLSTLEPNARGQLSTAAQPGNVFFFVFFSFSHPTFAPIVESRRSCWLSGYDDH